MIDVKFQLKRLVKILKANELKNIVILSGGTIVAQIIGLIAQPIATRLYTPNDFGVMAIILSLIGLFSSSLNGQYHLSIVTAKSDKEANSVAALAIYFGLIVSVIVSIGIIIYTLLNPITFASAGLWIYISIPFIILSGITNVISSYNNRFKQYKLLATVSLYRSIGSNLVKIGLGFAKIGFIGLIFSFIISILAGIRKQSEFFRKNWKEIFSTRKAVLILLLKKYKNQPLYSAPGIFAVSYSVSIIPLFIASLYGIKELGYYALATATLSLPFSLVTGNIGTVYFRQASKEKSDTGIFYNSFKSSLVLLVLVSIVPFLSLAFFSETLFAFVFGSAWFRSGTFVFLLLPWQWMNFIGGALACSLIISGNQLTKLLIQCMFIIEVVTNYYLSKYFHLAVEGFLLAISLSYAFTYMVLLLVIFKASKHQSKIIC
jgi:O-antigen/teichoic acid export membrane protein